MTEEKNNSEEAKNENNENKYLSQFYSFLNSNYIKNSFESKIENAQNKKKKHLSSRKAYIYLIRKFKKVRAEKEKRKNEKAKKVAVECDLYFEEIQIQNENEKLIIQLFGKNSVTIKKLYRKKKLIDPYFFLLILCNILSNLPYSIIPIQKFIDICDGYIAHGVYLLTNLNFSLYSKKKKIHKIYFEPVFYLFILLWNNHYFHISLSNTLVILSFFYKIYIILKKLEIRNVNLFDNVYVLCASYVNKINSMLWFSIFLIIKRMLIDECEIKIMKKRKTYLILPIFIDIIKIIDVYDEIIKKTNINPLVKLYEELKLFLLLFFHKLLYNLITEHDMLPRNIFKYLQINNNIISDKKKKYNKLLSYNYNKKDSSDLYNNFYNYSHSINEKLVFFSFFENFCLYNTFTDNGKTDDSFSSLSFSFNTINSSVITNENETVDKKNTDDCNKLSLPDPVHAKKEDNKPLQIIKMYKNKIDILNMQYTHFFIHKYKNENKYILLIKSYFNDYLCALVNSLYIYSKIIYSSKGYDRKSGESGESGESGKNGKNGKNGVQENCANGKSKRETNKVPLGLSAEFTREKQPSGEKCLEVSPQITGEVPVYEYDRVGGINVDSVNVDGSNVDGANVDGANVDGANACGANARDDSNGAGENNGGCICDQGEDKKNHTNEREESVKREERGKEFLKEETSEQSDFCKEKDQANFHEFHMIHRQKIQKRGFFLMERTKNKRQNRKNKLGHMNKQIINILISFIEVIYRNIFKKILKKIYNCKSINELKLYSYIEKIYEYNTYYCLKSRLKKMCFILFFSITLKNLIKSYLYKIKNEKIKKNNLEIFQSMIIYDTCSFIKLYNQLSHVKFKDFFQNRYINFLIYVKNILTLPREKLLRYPIKNKLFFFYVKNKRVDINFDAFIAERKLRREQSGSGHLKCEHFQNVQITNGQLTNGQPTNGQPTNGQLPNRQLPNRQLPNKEHSNPLAEDTYNILFDDQNEKRSQRIEEDGESQATAKSKSKSKSIVEETLSALFQTLSRINRKQHEEDNSRSYLCNSEKEHPSYVKSSHGRAPTCQSENSFYWADLGNDKRKKRGEKKGRDTSQMVSDTCKEIMSISESEQVSSQSWSTVPDGVMGTSDRQSSTPERQSSTSDRRIRPSERIQASAKPMMCDEYEAETEYDISSVQSYELDEVRWKRKKYMNLFHMSDNEKKYCIKVYIKNSNGEYDRKILLLRNDKLCFYDSENSISYDSFYFLMEIKKIYTCDGFFDSLINSQKISVVNSTYSSTDDEDEFYPKSRGSVSSESEWQKCGFDAKIIFHNSIRKNIHLMFIDQSYEKIVAKINSLLVHETDRTFDYINLSYDRNVEKEVLSEYFANNLNREKKNDTSFSTSQSSDGESIMKSNGSNGRDGKSDRCNDHSRDNSDEPNRRVTHSYENYESSENDLEEEGDNILNKILRDNKDMLVRNETILEHKKSKLKMHKLGNHIHFMEFKYASSGTDIYIEEKKYFFKKKKKKVKKENKMKLFKNINRNDVYDLFYEEICRLYKNKNNNISKTTSDDLYFYKSVNKLYHTVNCV
ncbi:conserved Plasmodium protein, unknown function [Plasmodium ovale]|uniref:Uncharacterized protein n=1 Tax=Plasmodium ovale TaxID=36330 RepID=A0A1D3RCZ7_PLAOA|nr:conserved Plasmodium protein, unknown function [Plasmodium ovale]